MTHSIPHAIFIVGKVGSGKGTQAQLLAQKTGYRIYSTGDEFRKLKEQGGVLGERIKHDYDAGLLMPHWFAEYLLTGALLEASASGVIFEGSGRKIEEAELIEKATAWLGIDYVVVEPVVSDDEVIRRIAARGRDSLDTAEKAKARLAEYDHFTRPVLDYFKKNGKLLEIDGSRTVEAIHADMCAKLNIA